MQTHFGCTDYQAIAAGESSQAFLFDRQSKVLRVNSSDIGFRKDDYAHRHVVNVPIPAVLEIGQLQPGLSFAVTQTAPGIMLLDADTSIAEELFRMMTAIWQQVPLGNNYGWWDTQGEGTEQQWSATLQAASRRYDGLLAQGDIAVTDEYRQWQTECEQLFDACPEERCLLHGDFGAKNILVDGNQVSGVIDWESSMYGDPVYDVASLDFWQPQHRFAQQFSAMHGHAINHFQERLRCYQLLIAMNALVKLPGNDGGAWVRQRIAV